MQDCQTNLSPLACKIQQMGNIVMLHQEFSQDSARNLGFGASVKMKTGKCILENIKVLWLPFVV